jgi:hypothetical protein
LAQPGLEPFHTLRLPRQIFGGKTPTQPARRFGRKGLARGQPQTRFGHQALGRGNRIGVAVEPEKRVHATFGRGQMHAGNGLQQRHQGVAASFEVSHHTRRDVSGVL